MIDKNKKKPKITKKYRKYHYIDIDKEIYICYTLSIKIEEMKGGQKMKKIVKVLLCLALVTILCIAPVMSNKGGPGPDDRPISYNMKSFKL